MSVASDYDLAGKVAVVTGGGSGIGAATALALAEQGARLVIAGRTLARLEAKAEDIRAATGAEVLAHATDVRDAVQCEALIAATLAHFGRINILVNNAGGTHLAALKDTSAKLWDKSFALNVDAAFHCTRAAGVHFLAQGSGSIVNVSSLAGIGGTLSGAPYSAAKAALQMFTRVAAAEWGPHGIRVNCVAPGMILTEIAEEHLVRSGLDIAEGVKGFPLRRAGTPADVAKVILFLVSEASGYITGETIAVGGGPQLRGLKPQ